jgi:hypothetical protein
MRHPFKIIAVAAALAGATMAIAAPALAARPLGAYKARYGDVRPSPEWRWARGCRGGRYYNFLGGWGCDFYRYPQYSGRR